MRSIYLEASKAGMAGKAPTIKIKGILSESKKGARRVLFLSCFVVYRLGGEGGGCVGRVLFQLLSNERGAQVRIKHDA